MNKPTGSRSINTLEPVPDIEVTSSSDEIEQMENSLPRRYGSINENSARRKRPSQASSASACGAQGIPNGTGTTTPSRVPIEKMRTRLQFYNMNPLEKWHTKRKFPFKLLIQVFKIIFVTIQLMFFASYRYANVTYTYDNKISLSNLLLMDWDPAMEVVTYPPTSGPLAVYTKDKFYESIDYVMNTYKNIQNISIGPYFHKSQDGSITPIEFCFEHYKNGTIFGFNESYIFDSETKTSCRLINLKPDLEFSSRSYFKENNITLEFSSLLEAKILFSLKTVRFRDVGPLKSPDCFRFDVEISFNNRNHDGQMRVSLEAVPIRLLCKGDTQYKANNTLEKIGRTCINFIVIAVSTLSLVLCCRAIYRAQLLKAEVIVFFEKYFNEHLSVKDRLEFLNFWYLLIIINDIFIIVGSALKQQIENKELTGEAWNVCSLFLGIGNLFVWFGVLRYLGFFRTYNVLILTLKRASPNVLRFLLCAMLIYSGFTFCGWLILGPYHIKFSTLSSTSECLFALINGDDMFATFASMSNKSTLLWWFCRFYLYSFISLFIYVVLSLFIALIMDAYETIKLYYTEGFPCSALQNFINGGDLDNTSINFSTDHATRLSMRGSMYQQHHCHHHMPSDDEEVNGTTHRKASAAGFLDTIVETICGCSTPNNIRVNNSLSRQTSNDEETTPLINT